ncbi:MAG: dipeptidase [bacterium]|nr:dipeptidase [bacterium]
MPTLIPARPVPLVVGALALAVALTATPLASACTNFLITNDASADGSTMVTYTADSHGFYGELYYRPPGRHAPGTMMPIYEWDTGKYLGEIAQAPVTYAVVGNMNEHQVTMAETTYGGRTELRNFDAILDYGSLIYVTLQRARTAREAIEIMAALVDEYGYYSKGETFSVGDPDEVWIMDLIGKGPEEKGAVWVARRVPDGYICGHANAARIRQFPLADDENALYAPDVIDFAREQGWYQGADEDFSFADVYDPDAFGTRRACEARVWCMFERTAPGGDHGEGWIMGEPGAEPVPLWIRPAKKLTVADVMGLMRDHYEDTALDMTTDIGAGPYKLPYRWRPMRWEVDGERYFHERAVSTQQTGFSFVAQMRSWLPDPIGGINWFGVDDTYTTVYFPAYAGITEAPYSFRVGTGSYHDVDYDAAFWAFNRVANYAYSRYADMIVDIRRVQQELEGRFLGEVPEVDAAAVALYEQSPRLARDYLTQYTATAGNETVARWTRLFDELLYKYLDGNVKDEFGKPRFEGYPQEWLQTIVAATGDRYRMRPVPAEIARKQDTEQAAQQEARALAESVVTLLEARGVEISPEQLERIGAVDDSARLRHWLVEAATAGTTEQVVESAP